MHNVTKVFTLICFTDSSSGYVGNNVLTRVTCMEMATTMLGVSWENQTNNSITEI